MSGVHYYISLLHLFELYLPMSGEASRTIKQVQKFICTIEMKRCEIGK
jgi:hypothetical protein